MQGKLDHNPFLAASRRPADEQAGDEDRIERPGGAQNIVWQTRGAPPTEWENRLGDALEAIFGDGVEDLPTVVARLNEMGMRDGSGAPWTEETFRREMARLGV